MKLASLTLAWRSSTGTEILTSIFHVGRITLLLALPLLLQSTATTVWNSHVVMIWNPLHTSLYISFMARYPSMVEQTMQRRLGSSLPGIQR
jgi:uncharacterized membrane protein